MKLRWLLLSLSLSAIALADAPEPPLRVCADPDNLPFSNQRGEGFENRLAELLARELGRELEYTWWSQRRGFFRNTIKAGRCDVVIGVPSELEMVATGRPYYRSRFAFLQRKPGKPIRSYDDPRLRKLRIGVTLIGDDGANPPPVHALGRRKIIDNVVGFSPFEPRDDGELNIVAALEAGKIDVAILWGPIAGWAAKRHPELRATLVQPNGDRAQSFAISLGVHHKQRALLRKLDGVLARRKPEVARILSSHGVPRP